MFQHSNKHSGTQMRIAPPQGTQKIFYYCPWTHASEHKHSHAKA